MLLPQAPLLFLWRYLACLQEKSLPHTSHSGTFGGDIPNVPTKRRCCLRLGSEFLTRTFTVIFTVRKNAIRDPAGIWGSRIWRALKNGFPSRYLRWYLRCGMRLPAGPCTLVSSLPARPPGMEQTLGPARYLRCGKTRFGTRPGFGVLDFGELSTADATNSGTGHRYPSRSKRCLHSFCTVFFDPHPLF